MRTNHHVVNWIPERYDNALDITHSFKVWIPDGRKPIVWVEHGAPDGDIIDGFKDRRAIYLCMCDQTYLNLTAQGYRAYYTGSIFQDLTLPDPNIHKNLLVYAPLHCSYVRHGESAEKDCPILTPSDLNELCIKHGCDDFRTSVVDDTDMLDQGLNLVYSHRDDSAHFSKCQALYSMAKIIISDENGTFCHTAESFGIPVDRSRVINPPREGFERMRVPNDGRCRDRVLNVLNLLVSEALHS